jgi:hypothetical protein
VLLSRKYRRFDDQFLSCEALIQSHDGFDSLANGNDGVRCILL